MKASTNVPSPQRREEATRQPWHPPQSKLESWWTLVRPWSRPATSSDAMLLFRRQAIMLSWALSSRLILQSWSTTSDQTDEPVTQWFGNPNWNDEWLEMRIKVEGPFEYLHRPSIHSPKQNWKTISRNQLHSSNQSVHVEGSVSRV